MLQKHGHLKLKKDAENRILAYEMRCYKNVL